MNNLINALLNKEYDLAVIDHERINNKNKTNNESLTTKNLPLSEVVMNLDYNLSSFSTLAVELDVYNMLKKCQSYKQASSMLIVSNETPQYTDILSNPISDEELARYLGNLLPNTLFLDAADFTLDLDPNETKKLRKQLLALRKKRYKVKYKKVKQPFKVKFRHQYEVTGKDNHKVIVLTESVNSNNRNVKLSFNPSKLTDRCLFRVLGCFKAACGSEFRDYVNTANITRIDYTIDLINIPVSQLIFLLSKGQFSQTFVDFNGNIETRIEGTSGFYVKAYNLTNHRLKQAIKDSNSERIAFFKALPPITRLEITLRPQKTGKIKGYQLKNLFDFPAPFEGIKLYNATNLFQKPELFNKRKQITTFGLHSVLRHKELPEYNRIRLQSNDARIQLGSSTITDQQLAFKALTKLLVTNSQKNFIKYCKQLSIHKTNDKTINGPDYV